MADQQRAAIDEGDDEECPRCHGDGMDPWNDYLLPCPDCGGEGTAPCHLRIAPEGEK